MEEQTAGDRLNKIIARYLAVGRRQADDFIAAGRVLVNDQPARMGQRVSDEDQIIVDGKALTRDKSDTFTYLALHKPIGYVCSRRQQGETPTIYSLLPESYQHLKPVGRLDKDSSGLLLLTDDGDFALRMTHPRFGKSKEYHVTIDSPLQPLHQQMIADFGVQLADGPSKLGLTRLVEGNDHEWQVTMQEGRNRQIRRTFRALGYAVTALHRTQFGPYRLDDLAAGKYKGVSQK